MALVFQAHRVGWRHETLDEFIDYADHLVPSPPCGMETQIYEEFSVKRKLSSEPTVWDGDLPPQG